MWKALGIAVATLLGGLVFWFGPEKIFPSDQADLREVRRAGNNLIGKNARYYTRPEYDTIVADYKGDNLADIDRRGMTVASRVYSVHTTAEGWNNEGRGLLRREIELPRTYVQTPLWQDHDIPFTTPIRIFNIQGGVLTEKPCSGLMQSGPEGVPIPDCIRGYEPGRWLLSDPNRHLAHVARVCNGAECQQRDPSNRRQGRIFYAGEPVLVCPDGDPNKPGVVVIGGTGRLQTGINDYWSPSNSAYLAHRYEPRGYTFQHQPRPIEECY